MTVYVGSASIDENGRAYGGRAGNQSGREIRKQAWYRHNKGWRVFRAKDAGAAARIARCMEMAIANRHIGYDQWERNSLYKAAEPLGFDVSRVTTDCETDCSALVRVCCAYAGIKGLTAEFRTVNEPGQLLSTGKFVELTGSRYTEQSAYLKAGDILVTRTSGHTVVALNDGDRAEAAPPEDLGGGDSGGGAEGLRRGDSGPEVKQMQLALIALGYDLGDWGADGDFGRDTQAAVQAFRRDRGLSDGGVYDAEARKALEAALAEQAGERTIRFSGDCYVRTLPSTDGAILGVAKRGSALPYGGETASNGWLSAVYRGGLGWVSGKYGRLVN